MAVVRLEIKTRQPLSEGRKFDHVGCYEQLDGSAHFAVDPAHRLNCAVTDIDLAERGRDGSVDSTADVRILAPADQARGNHRLLFDVPNRGNRLALATFNGVSRPINPAGPIDAGNGFLMRHGYTVVWCGWQHDVPEADGLMRIKVPRRGSMAARSQDGCWSVFSRASQARSSCCPTAATAHIRATIWTTGMLRFWCATARKRGHERSPAKVGPSPGWRRGASSPIRTTFISPPASSPAGCVRAKW